jgi:hypothetical protein
VSSLNSGRAQNVQIDVFLDGPRNDAMGGSVDPYGSRHSVQRVLDSLYVLAHSFRPPPNDGSLRGMENFMREYISNGTITRNSSGFRTADEDIYTLSFRDMHLASHRCASEPRDYIFATMPQFPWYHYPTGALRMSFSSIFADFHSQAVSAGHPFVCRITRSMTDPEDCLSAEEAWKPSLYQPEPSCLGDFLKLLGKRFLADSNHDNSQFATTIKVTSGGEVGQAEHPDNYHFTSLLRITGLDESNAGSTLYFLEHAMHFSHRLWRESHRGGELTKYGSWPELGSSDETYLRILSDTDHPYYSDPVLDSKRAAEIDRLQSQLVKIESDREKDEWLLPQATKILDHMWCAVDDVVVNRPLRKDWEYFKREMEGKWSDRMLQTLLLLAAMVSCQVPLSAIAWTWDRFVPVHVEYHAISVLGLLAKHACTEELAVGQPMLSGGRHTNATCLGRDLVIVDPSSKMPVGLVPDFLCYQVTDEEYVKRISALYEGLVIDITGKRVTCRHVPLDAVTVRRN